MMINPTDEQRLAVRRRPGGRSAVMKQAWRNLAFLHWRVPAATIQRTLPPGLNVDMFDDTAYIGIVPFYMRRIRPRFLPPVPGLSWFLETNVRTYVYDQNGVPGVWFYSLDCNQWLAVKIARRFFKLPYFHAKMTANRLTKNVTVTYQTQRKDDTSASQFVYRGIGPIAVAKPGSLEYFLAERYVLFAYSAETNTLFNGRVYHTPYPLQSAELQTWDAHLLVLNGFDDPARPPDHVLVSPGVSVDVFTLRNQPA
ncbi:MAG: DUF2071 domain-containing protein [Anaerolineae bacterium]|nr:DUF2071 domain-containing protein [Anaerolineae bacterium]